MTLAAQITSDVTDVFLETDDFADSTIKHYPKGDVSLEESVTGIFDEDDLTEATGGDGDGINLTNQRGIRIRRAGKLEISVDVEVTEEAPNQKASTFKIDGEWWVCKRVVGKDKDGMQTVLLVNTDQKATRRTQNV